MLNKYPVIANHFILATKTHKPQTNVLEEDDLAVAHACLTAWEESGGGCHPRKLFAFFNSGKHSGASQAHRHLQFLPYEDMLGPGLGSDWQLLTDRMKEECEDNPGLLCDPTLPFRHYAISIASSPSSKELHQSYLTLYRAAVEAMRMTEESAERDQAEAKDSMEATISYNLAMTKDRIAIAPRRSEAADLPSEDSTASVAINGTILGGTLMVKGEKEWQSLRQSSSVLDNVLTTIGVPISINDNRMAYHKL